MSFERLFKTYIIDENIFRKDYTRTEAIKPRKLFAGVILSITTSSTLDDIVFKVGISRRTLSRYINIFIQYLISISGDIIKLPLPNNQEFLQYKAGDEKKTMHGAVFAIDGTLINMKKTIYNGLGFLDRFGKQSINAMLIFGPGCHVVNMYVNKSGATHDSTVFKDSLFYQNINSGIINEGCFILGDGGYPLMSKLLTPYRSTRFNGEDDLVKEYYNYCQSSARMIAERGIGLLKGRISPLLNGLRTYNERFAVNFINGSIVFHEMLLQMEDTYHEIRGPIQQVNRRQVTLNDFIEIGAEERRAEVAKELYAQRLNGNVSFFG